nr:MAG TPA: hypothetical protein [Caudoviricetes sp.]
MQYLLPILQIPLFQTHLRLTLLVLIQKFLSALPFDSRYTLPLKGLGSVLSFLKGFHRI